MEGRHRREKKEKEKEKEKKIRVENGRERRLTSGGKDGGVVVEVETK